VLLVHYPEGLTLVEYLAKEQELVQQVKEPTLFTWIVAPTVIYGKHQSAEVEVNETYCAEHGIAVVQRKSGGGCVYADEGNLMISYIEPSVFSRQYSESPFTRFLKLIAEALQAKGLPAVTTAHNDILVRHFGCLYREAVRIAGEVGNLNNRVCLIGVNEDAEILLFLKSHNLILYIFSSTHSNLLMV
jgi:lipoate-protein ligase A